MSNTSRWQTIIQVAVGLALIGATFVGPRQSATAADPAFVGTLSLALEDDVAKRLEISDEVRAKLLDLVDRREMEALEKVMSIKDLPPSAQTEQLLPFVSESERMGLALLTVAQREKLRQVRIAREGMTALEEPGLAEALGLSSEQKSTVAKLLEQRANDLTRGGEKERRITQVIYERKLAGILDESQRSTWLRLAGYSNAAKARPAPAENAAEINDEAADEAAEEAASDEPPPAAIEDTAAEDGSSAETTGDADAAVAESDSTAEMAEDDNAVADAAEPVFVEDDAEQADSSEEMTQTSPVEATTVQENASEESGDMSDEATVVEADATSETPAETPVETPTEDTAPAAESDAGEPATLDVDQDAEAADPDPDTDTETEASTTDETDMDDVTQTAQAETESATSEPVEATEPASSSNEPVAGSTDEDGGLQFNFEAAPWKEVLDWFSQQADLSLAIETLPLGSFTYRDDREYTVDEALDLLNSYLLTKGYTLVRRQRILLVIDLEDDNPIPPELVTLVTTDELDERGAYELVKCLFPLARMKADDAAEMIQPFLGPQGAVVPFTQARQVLVVETAGKLRAIRDMIQRVEDPTSGGAETVAVMELKYVTADEVLAVARPLLGLTDDANTSDEISLSLDLLGTRIFATGESDKLALLRELIPMIDRAPAEADPEAAEPEIAGLKTYFIKSADTQVVLRVVQTIMANLPGVRMEVDETSGKLVVLARPAEHKTIQATIDELEGQALQFEVIPLKRTDPQLAVMAVNKFFNLTGDDENATNKDGPIVDGDPISMQLWVRGTTTQIDQIKDLVQKLEGPEGDETTGPTVRMIPLTGPEAQSALDTIQQFWVRKNRIRMVTPSNLTPSKIQLRTVTPLDEDSDEREEQEAPQGPFSPRQTPSPSDNPSDDASAGRAAGRSFIQFASRPVPVDPAGPNGETPTAENNQQPEETVNAEPAEIRIAITPGGILIASEDTGALDALEEMLRTVAGPTAVQEPRETTVFYLKYAKAEIADQLIQEILSGRTDEMGGSLLGDMASDLLGGGLLGALAGGLGGGAADDSTGSIQASGVITIVPDPRLNALIVEANPADLETVENLLKVIDREDSITDILTTGTPRLIPVIYSSADEVAGVIKQVFANKIATAQGQGGQGNQPSPEDMMRALRGQRSSRETSQARGEEQKMTIGVDARSNAIIVTGPQKLFEQVQAMVQLIDQPGGDDADVITVVPVRISDPEVMQKALESILESAKTSTSSSNPSGGGSSGGSSSGPSPDDIRRRIEMFRQMQGGGRPGGSPFGGGRPSGGSSGGRPSSSRGGRGGR